MAFHGAQDGNDFEEGNIVLDTSSGKHHGIALWPVPSDDLNDPIRWSRWLKVVAFLCACLCNFSSNISGAGISIATPQLIIEFERTANQVNRLLAYNFLFLGLGNLFWVPLAVKFGKRVTLITSMTGLFLALVWCAVSKSFESLLAARCFSGFAAAAGESIVPAIVSDIFFLHERATMMGIYVILTSGGSAVGPLIGGYMVEYTGSWRYFVWFSAALAGFNVLLLVVAFPETNFHRPTALQTLHATEQEKDDVSHVEQEKDLQEDLKNAEAQLAVLHGVQAVNVSNPSSVKILKATMKIDGDVNFFLTLLHPLVFLTYPSVIWAIFVYGVALSPQIILIFIFPSLLQAPPYLFNPGEVGLMQVAAIIGFAFACFGGGWVSDVITARRIVKSGGIVYPEQRLLSLIPGAWMAPAGCILIAFAGSRLLSWPSLAVGFGMLSFGTVYSPNIAITYVVDSYPRFAAESLVLINVFKNIVAFIFIFVAVDWLSADGFLQVYMIMFMLVCISILLAVPLYFYGRSWRLAASKSTRHNWFL